jgi:hypothetical protein
MARAKAKSPKAPRRLFPGAALTDEVFDSGFAMKLKLLVHFGLELLSPG